MRQTLIEIPLSGDWQLTETWAVPGFGLLGFPMFVWLVVGVAWWVLHRRELKEPTDYVGPLGTWLLIAVVIAILPSLPFDAGRSIPIFGYGFMLFLGLLVAGYFAARRALTVNLPGDLIWDLALWVFFAGIVGARLFFLVQYRERIFADKQTLKEYIVAVVNLPDGGLVFYGGLLMAVATFFVFCRVRRIKPLLLADVVVPSVFIGLAFGRVGCFLNGCCYGDRCELPWAVTFPKGSVPFEALVIRGFLDPHAAATYPLHPAQLYSSLSALLLACLTAAYFWHRTRDGDVLALGIIIYPVTRIVLEFLRGDELGKFNTSLTISQWVSLGLLVVGLVYVVWLKQRPKYVTRPVSARNRASRIPAPPQAASALEHKA